MSFEIPSPFQWDESFCVGNAEINEQHKKLFQLINALDADRTNGAVLKELLDYVVMHFKTEEDGFDRVAWDQKDAHKEVHDNFVKTAVSLTSVDDGVIQFIKQWLVDHIKGSDMKYKGVFHIGLMTKTFVDRFTKDPLFDDSFSYTTEYGGAVYVVTSQYQDGNMKEVNEQVDDNDVNESFNNMPGDQLANKYGLAYIGITSTSGKCGVINMVEC
nr:unnamed protein product [Naegleria fowleri]